MPHEKAPQSAIAERHDAFRRTGQFLVTQGVLALPEPDGLLQAVRHFDDFTPDNDPHGEHDFGAIDWHGERTFWKIDYYDQTLSRWEDPLSPDCQRILTVMLASEY
jgi:hypothetical protein